ncbi:uncharacterized protein LOC119442153 [Dermacentor silvarum]|uniref:uncharacterized protein LOC119442153 n=1 Tax=Dermacentor silvarum TaxID=543639 RepID=UPI002100DE0A|nr:uncharacterized protein LOC119442153 [Dermacentor silvarum]
MRPNAACLALRLASKFERIPAYRLREPPWSFRACSHASVQERHRNAQSRVSSLKTDIFEAMKGYPTMSEYPELLYLSPEAVEDRQKELFTVFPNKDIVKLVETCPQAFVDDWDEIMEKVNYIAHGMVISPEHIISSAALGYSLLHIKTRHQFLLCCGKYRTPKPKEVTTTNPPLDKIIGLPLRLYLNICGVTAEEYHVFEKLMKKEQEREADEDSDDELD